MLEIVNRSWQNLIILSSLMIFLASCTANQSNGNQIVNSSANNAVDQTSTFTISPTETSSNAGSLTWETGIREIFEIQCTECHLSTPTGGFSITSYTKVLQGSNLGQIIIPGNPDESHLFYKLKFGGNHPGYMSKEQTDLVWEWVSNGAPEK